MMFSLFIDYSLNQGEERLNKSELQKVIQFKEAITNITKILYQDHENGKDAVTEIS